ncbi:hypothetical protein OB2597_02242 [Pseudooceanicola batsensis HTCC2597]|uniref:DUF2147 domain-containing protein n=1 Tax=Pseudooceanicola batsensis (strain ATCC BAA-863 / DSM 15984 / KCTC 12145 / HTCC2597) TaxID=252305 RepID=A3TX42_PSEBH|nr:DUF2147 domain-containing protein [Pseudooceanicola batsensis]EAQ03402.1 hypothetical protein OB2597_02242 [Pseudooceanicola batsensis HTCC2597]
MRNLMVALAGLVLSAGAALADPVEGTWQTQVDDGAYAHVRIAPCGPAYCGTMTRTFNSDGEYKSPNLGKQLVRDMKPVGGGKYEGKVWRPSNDKIYFGKLELAGDRLKMKGCVAGGLICSGQTWARVN